MYEHIVLVLVQVKQTELKQNGTRCEQTLRIGGVPFLMRSRHVMIFRSRFSSLESASSSTCASSLSKYCRSSGFSSGMFSPGGCRSTTPCEPAADAFMPPTSGVPIILKPTGVPPTIGVGVASSLRPGVRIGT